MLSPKRFESSLIRESLKVNSEWKSMQAIVIRPTRAGDLVGIHRCMQQMTSWLPPKSQLKAIESAFLSQPWVCSFVAEETEGDDSSTSIKGFSSISFETKIRGGVIGHIEDVVVDVEWQRSGIGSALIKELLSEADRRGAYRVFLECSDANVAFYKACGFQVSGVSMSWTPHGK